MINAPDYEKERFGDNLVRLCKESPRVVGGILLLVIGAGLTVAYNWASALGGDVSKLREQMIVQQGWSRGAAGERGPQGERGPPGVQGERGPPGSSPDIAHVSVEIERLNRQIAALQRAIDEVRGQQSSLPISAQPSLSPLQVPTVAFSGAAPSQRSAGRLNAGTGNDCRIIPSAGLLKVRVGEILCSADKLARSQIVEADSSKIRVLTGQTNQTCYVGDVCELHWSRPSARYRLISVIAGASAEIHFE